MLVFQADEGVANGLAERPLDQVSVLDEDVDEVGEDQPAAGLDVFASLDRGLLSARPGIRAALVD